MPLHLSLGIARFSFSRSAHSLEHFAWHLVVRQTESSDAPNYILYCNFNCFTFPTLYKLQQFIVVKIEK